MATTSKKTKTKRRPPSKAKAKRAATPLLATSATVRKAGAGDKRAPAAATVPAALNPALAMFQFMSRVTAAYAELPSRLVQCRSPMDLWREQARFAQRIVDECQSAAPGASPRATRR